MNIASLGEARFPSPVVSDQVRIPAVIVRDPDAPKRDEVLFELAGPRAKLFFDPAKTRAGIVTCGGLCPGMNNVTTVTSFPPLCQHDCQHGQKCEAQDSSWSRTHKQLEAWLRPRPRITGRSAEKLALMGGTSACWVQYITESTEGGAMYH